MPTFFILSEFSQSTQLTGSLSPLRVLITVLIAISPMAIGFAYNYWKIKRWENEILPKEGNKTDHYFVNAYLCMAVWVLKSDRRDLKSKQLLLRNSLAKKVDNLDTIGATFESIWKREVRVTHVAKWVNLRLNRAEREELLYLLVALAMVDGVMLQKEHAIIAELAQLTGISQKQLRSILASYRQRKAREEAKANERRRTTKKTVATPSKRERAAEILGISPHASKDEIKKAYRTLVKKHHPDRFAGKSETLIQAAKERFIEIQEAYDLLSSE